MHLMESIIDSDSISFEIIKYIINDKSVLTLDGFKFTSKTLKYIFGEKMKDEDFKKYIILELKKLISSGYIVTSGKNMNVTEKMINKFYNIS